MESFTMSVDRGYLGRAPGDRDPALHRSMDDLTFQKTKGSEIVRLLRVINCFSTVLHASKASLVICVSHNFSFSSKSYNVPCCVIINRTMYFQQEAEKTGFTAEDVQVALNHCDDANPVGWLKDNWDNMMDTVVTLASNVGHEAEENTIGTLSKSEAKEALRKHKGNIWAAVTECVEQRQSKVMNDKFKKSRIV